VSSKNIHGIKSGMDYFFKNGHKRIAFLRACYECVVARNRLTAYEEYMKKEGEYREEYIFQGDFSFESGYDIVPKLLDLDEIPTAVLAANDHMALGLIKGLKERGYRVPEDISVMGFDNIAACEYSDPRLTTIAQNPIKIGEEAVKFILDENREKKICKIDIELIIRDSVRKKED
jgi:DNA-binding LacI/PurR family transcriptional regulator